MTQGRNHHPCNAAKYNKAAPTGQSGSALSGDCYNASMQDSAEHDERRKAAALLRKYGLHPKRGLGQNFLTSASALRAILDAADVAQSDAVLEIGPGLGVLTRELAARVKCVLAVELDERLVHVVNSELSHATNLRVLNADILRIQHADAVREHCGAETYKVVANLPYYITSIVLRKLLEEQTRPELIVVMVQKEVAERAIAGPGQMSLLALSVQLFSEPHLVARVPANAFLPPPDVESAILRLSVHPAPLFPDIDYSRFFKVAAAGFGQKRKTLVNSLSSNLKLDKATVTDVLRPVGIDPTARAQELSLEEWANLCRLFTQLEL